MLQNGASSVYLSIFYLLFIYLSWLLVDIHSSACYRLPYLVLQKVILAFSIIIILGNTLQLSSVFDLVSWTPIFLFRSSLSYFGQKISQQLLPKKAWKIGKYFESMSRFLSLVSWLIWLELEYCSGNYFLLGELRESVYSLSCLNLYDS